MNKKIFLYILNYKGLTCLKRIVSVFGASVISGVQYDTDENVLNDYSAEIKEFLVTNNIRFCHRKENSAVPDVSSLSIAIGWRRIIPNLENLIVFHDSLLPRLRGFNPLVTALLNKDPSVGVSVLWAQENYDRGAIIAQARMDLSYPSKLKTVIGQVSELYATLIEDVVRRYLSDHSLNGTPQNETEATYSVWRDDDDYTIHWQDSAEDILNLIFSVGDPYLGAKALVNGQAVRIHDAVVVSDLKIENRVPGKVFAIENDGPVVMCGQGLICLTDIRDNNQQVLKIKNLRTRFM